MQPPDQVRTTRPKIGFIVFSNKKKRTLDRITTRDMHFLLRYTVRHYALSSTKICFDISMPFVCCSSLKYSVDDETVPNMMGSSRVSVVRSRADSIVVEFGLLFFFCWNRVAGAPRIDCAAKVEAVIVVANVSYDQPLPVATRKIIRNVDTPCGDIGQIDHLKTESYLPAPLTMLVGIVVPAGY